MKRFLFASIAFFALEIAVIIGYANSIEWPISFRPGDLLLLAILPGLSLVFFMIWIRDRKYTKQAAHEIPGSQTNEISEEDNPGKNILENYMDTLLTKNDSFLTEKQKKILDLIERFVPHDDPKKVKIKKKFFRVDFEDLGSEF